MYIEYYIIENLLINYIIISCTSILIKKHNDIKKKLAGAFLGALYSVAYLYPALDILFTVPFKVVIMTVITLVCFTYSSKREYIRILFVFYLVNIFISGSTYFIIYFTGIEHLKISFMIVCAYVSCELLKYIYRDIKMIRYIKDLKKTVTIKLLGQNYNCEALLDSGNLLKDPISNNDVVIVKSSVFKNLLPDILNYDYNDMDIIKIEEIIEKLDDEISNRVRLIPYKHANNNNSDIILGLKADYIEIDKQKIGNIVLGITNFNDEEYSAILNPNILSEV